MPDSFDTIKRIKELCSERGYSYYELAKRSHVPYSTLNTMISKNNAPTLTTMEKLCDGFGLSLIQFFQGGENAEGLTDRQRECLSLFGRLPYKKQELALQYIKELLQEP